MADKVQKVCPIHGHTLPCPVSHGHATPAEPMGDTEHIGLMLRLRREGRVTISDRFDAADVIAALVRERNDARNEAEANRDMLDTARQERDDLRLILRVPYEPHQSLAERSVEIAENIMAQLDAANVELRT